MAGQRFPTNSFQCNVSLCAKSCMTELIVSELWYEADQIDGLILGFFELFSEKHELKDSEIEVLRGVDTSEFETLFFYCCISCVK